MEFNQTESYESKLNDFLWIFIDMMTTSQKLQMQLMQFSFYILLKTKIICI